MVELMNIVIDQGQKRMQYIEDNLEVSTLHLGLINAFYNSTMLRNVETFREKDPKGLLLLENRHVQHLLPESYK
jgi:hypothetical protein